MDEKKQVAAGEKKYFFRNNIRRRLLASFLILVLVGGTALAYSVQIKDLQMQYVGTVLEYASQVLSENTEYLDQSVLDRAWRVLRTAIRKPKTYEQFDTYASLATAKGNYDDAAVYMTGCIDTYSGDNSRELATLWLRKGSLHTLAEEQEEALTCYGEALELDETLTDAYLLRAQTYSELGRLDEAAEDLVRYQELAGDNPVIQSALGGLYEMIENYQNAVACYSAAIDSGKYELSNLASRGRCRILLGDTEGALNDLQRFFDEGGTDEAGDYYAMLGMCRMEVGEYSSALNAFHKALARGYSDPVILLKQCVVAAYIISDFDTVIEDGAKVMDIPSENVSSDEDLAEIFQWIGFANFVKENYAEAGIAFEKALSVNSELPLIPYYAGICFMSANEHEKAVEYFKQSASHNEYMTISLYDRALCLMELGDYKAAEQSLKAAVDANDDADTVVEARLLYYEVRSMVRMDPTLPHNPEYDL